jgi:hypothetical protein
MGILIKDWSKFEWSNPAHIKTLYKNAGKFISGPTSLEYRQTMAKIQEFGTPGDFPTSVLEVLAKFHQTQPYDMGWQQIYKVLDLTASKRNGWDISTVQSGITFDKKVIGDKLEVKKMWGDKAHVYCDFYGGALGWHQSLFDDEEYWTIEDNAIEFRSAAYYRQALVHYALIEAVGATKAMPWQQPSPIGLPATDATYSANRDIRTMNAAALQIFQAVEGRGYNVNPQGSSFIVLTPLELQDRVKAALSLRLQSFSESTGMANFSFRPLYTNMLVDKTHAWVILPGNKIQSGIRMDLRMFENFDMLSYTKAAAGWMRYGAAVGDTDQVVRIAFA